MVGCGSRIVVDVFGMALESLGILSWGLRSVYSSGLGFRVQGSGFRV